MTTIGARSIRRAVIGALAGALLVVAVDPAHAGKYTVSKCTGESPSLDTPDDPHVWADPHDQGTYTEFDDCGQGDDRRGGIRNTGSGQADKGQFGAWSWLAPAGTTIAEIGFSHRLRNDSGHRGRAYAVDTSGQQRTLATGSGSAEWETYGPAFDGVPKRQFVLMLACDPGSGSQCPHSGQAEVVFKGVNVTLNDSQAPTVSASGPLLAGGWRRHTQSATASAHDVGGGLRVIWGSVNGSVAPGGTFVACSTLPSGKVSRMLPCPLDRQHAIGFDTTRAPFHDGDNAVGLCAQDFATSGTANARCATRTVRVDNTPPALAFRNSQSPADPELIRARAADPHSGVVEGRIAYRREGTGAWTELPTVYQAGELRARIDSEAVPPGRYEFMVRASDRAGNESPEVTVRENGQPMVLTLPLRTGSELRSTLGEGTRELTVDYGRESEVAGRLRSVDGDPLAFQTLVVAERFDPGSLEAQRRSEVVTDRDGRFVLPLPPGPSREVDVAFRGSRTHQPAASAGLDLNVRSGATFATSKRRVPGGRAVAFRGKVMHDGAEIPPGGKLVELQVREGARKWGTVREAFATAGDGSYRLRYRFARFYTRPVTFRFRVKVTREQRWPYHAPIRSRARRVTVVP